MKEETRKVVVLDWEDKIKLQSIIKDLERTFEIFVDSKFSPAKVLYGNSTK